MNWSRIKAIIVKNMFYFRRNLDRRIEIFYWPTIDLILWGITSLYFAKVAPENTYIVGNIVLGTIFWYMLWQAQNEINIGILAELWNENLVNLFVTPLKFSEYVTAFILSGLAKFLFMTSFASVVAFILYQINIFKVGLWIVPLGFLLSMTGWVYSFLISGAILRFGTRIQSLSWSLIFVLAPFSAVYFPVVVLPDWAQAISRFMPASYLFEAIREVNMLGTFPVENLVLSFLLNLIYIIIAGLWLSSSFDFAHKNGLVKLK